MTINTLPYTQFLTKNQWLNVLSRQRASGWPSRFFLPRRKHSRYPVQALATLATASADGGEEKTFCKKYRVLDVSDDGLAIQSYRSIPPGTVLSIEIYLGGQTVLLSGTVVHSTGYPGSFRVGIKLEFAETDGESEGADS